MVQVFMVPKAANYTGMLSTLSRKLSLIVKPLVRAFNFKSNVGKIMHNVICYETMHYLI